ncbi:MAG: trigger factor [Thermodesulfovibrionales bacterium]|nr:trigger factor [Thermodesulfovibrionales bacterium]
MLKTIEDISQTKKRLKIEIPSDVVEKEIGSALQSVRQRVKLPGFRQGKVPIALIEKRFGKEVEADAIEKLISSSYATALKEADITPVSSPVMEENFEFKRQSPLSMTLTVEVRPKVEGLKYEGIKVRDIPVDVPDDDVEKTLKRLQAEKAVYEPSDKEMTEGDVAIIDLKGAASPGESGAAPGETEAGLQISEQLFKVGSDYFPPEISEGLKGRKKGDEFSLKADFPEGFHINELAGRKLELTVFVKEVKKANLPDMDDELAKDLGMDSMDALRGHIKEELLKAKKNAVAKMLKAEVVKNIINETAFEAPESLVGHELSQLMDNARLSGAMAGVENDTLKKELRPAAERNIKAALLIEIIGEKEGVTVTEDELKKEILSLSGRLRMSPENVMKYFITRDGSIEGLRRSVIEEKVLNLLLEKAEIEGAAHAEEGEKK